jgi:tripartite-type tricarboxylate transporter receptor subunit TctC
VISQPLNKALGTSVIIENKGGAGGSVGSALAARAPADGFTIRGWFEQTGGSGFERGCL